MLGGLSLLVVFLSSQPVVSQSTSFRAGIGFVASRNDSLDLPYVITGDQAPQYPGATPFRQSHANTYKHCFAQGIFVFEIR